MRFTFSDARVGRGALASGFVLALALFCAGCITRPSKVDVYSKGGIDVFLRSEVRGFSTIEKSYAHPVTIAPVRIAFILSRIDLSNKAEDKDRVPAVETDMLFPIAEGVSQALAQANPNQEVVVMAVKRTKRWGLFDHDFLTSFLVYVRDERLYLHMGNYDWQIPQRREKRLPEPHVGTRPQRFHLYPGTAMALVDSHSLAIDWRDPIFSHPTRTAVQPSGEVVRKTILLESSPEELELEQPVAPLPENLTPQQLRDLADIEQARRDGQITESEYRVRRREILGGS